MKFNCGMSIKMGDVINIEANLPHVVREVICVECRKRWIACYPQDVRLKDLECPNGHSGAVIATGCESIIEES